MSGAQKYKLSIRKLQHIYDRHAADFGVHGSKNAARLIELQEAIMAHLAGEPLQVISGHYRGNPAVLHYSSETGILTVVDQSNNIIAGFRISAAQAAYVEATGRLN